MVRHPLYIGWLTIFWAAPTMTVAHLVFALATTAYILIAIQLEERDLVDAFGETYLAYRRRTPMLIPRFGRNRAVANIEAQVEEAWTMKHQLMHPAYPDLFRQWIDEEGANDNNQPSAMDGKELVEFAGELRRPVLPNHRRDRNCRDPLW